MEALSKATGGNVITNIDDLSDGDLGQAAKVEERKSEMRHGIHHRLPTSQEC